MLLIVQQCFLVMLSLKIIVRKTTLKITKKFVFNVKLFLYLSHSSSHFLTLSSEITADSRPISVLNAIIIMKITYLYRTTIHINRTMGRGAGSNL